MSPRAECGKKDVEGLYRCELKPGHRGEHQAEWEGQVITWGRDKQTSRRIHQPSTKQELRSAFLAGVKASWFVAQVERDGFISCEVVDCPVSFFPPEFEQAWEALDVHHTRARSSGEGYQGGTNFGVDNPANLQLLCRAHHRAQHGQPQWSKAAS